MRRETQNPLISSQILSPFAEQSSLALASDHLQIWQIHLWKAIFMLSIRA
jgi:hypothetical protein